MTRDIRIALSLRMPGEEISSLGFGDRTADGWVLVSEPDDMLPEHQAVLDEFGMIEITLCDTKSHAAAICGAIDRLELPDVKTAFAQLQDGEGVALVIFPDGANEIFFHDGRVKNEDLDSKETILRSWEMTAEAFTDIAPRGYAIGDRLTRTVMDIMVSAGNLDAVHDVQHKLQAIPGADVMVISTSVGDHEDDMARLETPDELVAAHAAVLKVVKKISLDSAKSLVAERVIEELRDAAPDLFPAPGGPGMSGL